MVEDPILKRSLAVAAALLVAGCAPAHVPWSNSQVPKDQWSRDWSACKRSAEADVLGYRGEEESDRGSPFRDYDRAKGRRQIDAEVAMCMTDLGYTPVRKKD